MSVSAKIVQNSLFETMFTLFDDFTLSLFDTAFVGTLDCNELVAADGN